RERAAHGGSHRRVHACSAADDRRRRRDGRARRPAARGGRALRARSRLRGEDPGGPDRADPDRVPWCHGADPCARHLPADVGPGCRRARQALMRARGFTLIELFIVICVVAVTFGVALERLLRYQEMGERAALEQNLAAINTALTMRFAAYVASGRPEAIRAELDNNPVDLLSRPPQNYLGELYAPPAETLERPYWY